MYIYVHMYCICHDLGFVDLESMKSTVERFLFRIYSSDIVLVGVSFLFASHEKMVN